MTLIVLCIVQIWCNVPLGWIIKLYECMTWQHQVTMMHTGLHHLTNFFGIIYTRPSVHPMWSVYNTGSVYIHLYVWYCMCFLMIKLSSFLFVANVCRILFSLKASYFRQGLTHIMIRSLTVCYLPVCRTQLHLWLEID